MDKKLRMTIYIVGAILIIIILWLSIAFIGLFAYGCDNIHLCFTYCILSPINCFFGSVAKLTKEVRFCYVLTEGDIDCYALTTANKDIEYCKKIGNIDAKAVCLIPWAAKTNNISMCDQMGTYFWKDRCYYKCAVGRDNISDCEKYSQETYKKDCIAGYGPWQRD